MEDLEHMYSMLLSYYHSVNFFWVPHTMQGDILQILAKPLMYVIAAASYSRIVL